MVGTLAVAGAAGKTGRAIVSAALNAGWMVREITTAHGDLRDSRTLLDACVGVDVLYHLAPNMSPDEEQMAANAISACRAHGVRLVFHSVLAPQIRAMPHHWRKLRVEERLWAAADIDWVVLRPAPYFQNLAPYVAEAEREGYFQLPYDPDRPIAMVDLADVGEAAVAVLDDPAARFGSWDLCGEAGVTHTAIAAMLGAGIERVRPAAWPVPSKDLTAMFEWYDEHGLPGSTRSLRLLLGREPRALSDYLERLRLPRDDDADAADDELSESG